MRPQSPARRPWLARTGRVLLLGGLLTIGLAALRHNEASGVVPTRFWLSKVGWRHNADVVILGDSRAYMAVAPEVLAPHLGNVRVRNFGFDACGYYADYVAAAEKVLDPRSRQTRVILAITPRSLTPGAEGFNGYRHYRRLRLQHNWLDMHLLEVYAFFGTMEPKEVWFGIAPGLKKEHFYRVYHADGWMAGERVPPLRNHNLPDYKYKVFVDNTFDPGYEKVVLGLVRHCAERGVRVYAFRPPTCAEMVKVENELSGFDEAAFVERFTAAGGIWLDTDQTAYETIDESHLGEREARRFSDDLGRAIAAFEAGGDAGQTRVSVPANAAPATAP